MNSSNPDFSSIPQLLRDAVRIHWQRFTENLAHLDPNRKTEILKACIARKELPAVWSASEFIAANCVANPEFLFDLISSGDLDRSISPEILTEHYSQFVGSCENEQILHARLRQFRKREMVRIAWRDLAGVTGLDETMDMVTTLAESSIGLAYRFHYAWLSERFGHPVDESAEQSRFVVLGLGKLGGRELNYSSDVDLLFAYSRPGSCETTGANSRQLDNQEFFTRLGRKIIAALDPITEDGFVFRTDLRLRPNGDSGPLVLSFPAMEHYYQTHGRSWERYALIKARVVAGDAACAADLLGMLKPFVYRKYLDFSAYEAIREMKGMITRELRNETMEQNIKLGRGGIREIEFFVQSHQLIRGGRESGLRTSSIYSAMESLTALGVIDSDTRNAMVNSYEFLRNTEHRLQMVADRQTQTLPASEAEKLRLAWTMGYPDWGAFQLELENHRVTIHQQFRLILDPEQESGADGDRNLSDVWHANIDQQQAEAVLREAGFTSTDNIVSLLKGFHDGRLYQAFSGIDRDRMDRLMPLALARASRLPEAERAISAFVSVIEGIGRRSVYLSLLIENPIALKQLLHLCAASPWISRHIGQHPVILDELLNPLVDVRNRKNSELEQDLMHRLSQLEADDEEGKMNTTREFQHAQVLQIASADVSAVLDVDDVHHALTQLAEVLMENTLRTALEFTSNKYGDQPGEAGIIAYGKFASSELGYHSDLDVVVCYQLPENNPRGLDSEAEYFYSRVGRRLIHLLTTRTQAGNLYDLDMRLRPSGRSGTLVTSLGGFFDYQLNNAWTWEHQALVRARVVVGSDDFVSHFEEARKTVLSRQRNDSELKQDIVMMRRKMIDANCQSTSQVYDIKLDEGGIVDIEFLLQYWILREAHDHPELTMPRTTPDCIVALVALGVIDESTGDTIASCYRTYLRQSLDLKLMDLPVLVDQGDLKQERAAISLLWATTFG